MINKVESEYETAIGRLICGGEITDKATAFLISPTKAITATHALDEYYLEEGEICLEFLNINKEPIKRKASPIKLSKTSHAPISILELEEPVQSNVYLKFCNSQVQKDSIYETFGYPVVKWEMGHRVKNTVLRKVTSDMTNIYDWDIDLNYEANLEDFSGLSGAPLFVNGNLVGVVLTESVANDKVISLGSISVERIKDILLEAEIPIDEPIIDLSMDEIYDLDENTDFSESIFIVKLESAKIYDHEDCQQEFFNAEIAKSSIEGRGISTEIKSLLMLRNNLKSVWKTQHRVYKDEQDGNELLTKVYERVEELNDSTLKSNPDLSLIAKKGVLHQLSDECKVGWTKNYKIRLKEYLSKKGEKDD